MSQKLNELRARREALSKQSEKTFSDMKSIIDRSYQMADQIHDIITHSSEMSNEEMFEKIKAL